MTFCFINDHVKKLTLKLYLCWLQLILFINFVNIIREFILSHDPHFFGDFLSFQRINFYGMFNLKLQIYLFVYKVLLFHRPMFLFAFENLQDCICNHSRYRYHRNIFLRHIYLLILITCRFTVDTDRMEIIIFLRHIYFLTSYLSIDCMSVYFLLENSSIMYVESLILLKEGCKVKAVLGVYNSVEAAPYFFQSHPKNHPFHSLAHYCNQNVSRIYSNSDIHGQLCLL